MLVIVLENISPKLKGYLSSLMTEIHAGIFVGDYSKRVRERLWMTLVDNIDINGNAIMIWDAPTESGYDFTTIGSTKRELVNNYGNMIVKVPKRTRAKK
jgi:CRISPR-associated protein Cas2